jgi:D-arabinose 1-dehydrogenase-like Zn-dependent alcohol dehydrogenase
VPISPALIAMKGISILGSMVGSLDEMHEVMKIARAGILPELPLTTRPLDQLNDALIDLKQGRVRGRIVMLP